MDFLELDRQIRRFLTEDIGQGDLTTDPIFSTEQECSAVLVSRESLVAAGMENVAGRVFHVLNPAITVSDAVADGEQVEAGAGLLRLQGSVRDILRGERVALNLVQRTCGIIGKFQFVLFVCGSDANMGKTATGVARTGVAISQF